MRKPLWLPVAAALVMAAVPAAAQEGHAHEGAAAPEGMQMQMCRQMMEGHQMGQMMGGQMGQMSDGGHGMMDGQDMMGGAGMMSGGMGMGMMPVPGPGPSMILSAAAELGLDEAQQERLTALQARSQEIHEAHMASASASRAEAAAIFDADEVDLDAYEQALWEAAQHMITVHLSMVRIGFEARSVLSADQLSLLNEGHEAMGAEGRGMMKGPESTPGHAAHHG